MPLQPPSAQSGVPRSDVGEVVDAMLLDRRVQWIAIVVVDSAGEEDRFDITPWIVDPTKSPPTGAA
jgi:hypothetical protein